MSIMPSGVPSRPERPLRNSLDGPSRTITVEPVQVPVTAPEPRTTPEREPARPAAPARPAQPVR
jgi:hypothetical protein